MPVYLIHGFRWLRTPIREFVILQNVNDAAPDYLMQVTTPAAIKAALIKLHPDIMKRIPEIHFIEQHDPADENPDAVSQPYAFVADKVIEADLSINIREAQEKNPITAHAWDAFIDLKEALAGSEAEMGWFVVFNGDPDRAADVYQQDLEEVEVVEPEEIGAGVEACCLSFALLCFEANSQQIVTTRKEKDSIFKRIFRKGSSKSKYSAIAK